jgi:hypothetical protein
MTKIKDIRFFKAISPLSRPIADSTHQIEQIAVIVARLELETGTTGDLTSTATPTSAAARACPWRWGNGSSTWCRSGS